MTKESDWQLRSDHCLKIHLTSTGSKIENYPSHDHYHPLIFIWPTLIYVTLKICNQQFHRHRSLQEILDDLRSKCCCMSATNLIQTEGRYFLKLIIVIFLWIHTVHSMCSWTCLDPSFIPNTPKSSLIVGSVHTESMATLRQFMESSMDPVGWTCWNSSLSLFYGFILSISCIAGPVWTLLSSQTPQNHPGSVSATQKAWQHLIDRNLPVSWRVQLCWDMLYTSQGWPCAMNG